MSKTKQTTPALAIMVEPVTLKTSDFRDTSTFYRLSFVTVGENGEVRNVTDSFDTRHLAGLEDLVFRLWISWNDNRFTADQWEVLYNQVYSVNLSKAEKMVKTLKRVQKISEKWIARPQTFGQFVAMISIGLKVTHFVQLRGASRGWHSDNDYIITKGLDDLASTIDRHIEEAHWRTKFPPQEAV